MQTTVVSRSRQLGAALVRRIPRPVWVLLISLALLGLYPTLLHPWMISWGSTPSEQQMALPGDQYPPDSGAYHTRAITIDAPVSVVWQWLVQHGQDQAGFYSNDYLENLFFADIHNSDQLHPEWQGRAVGDKIPMARPDILGGSVGESLFLRIVALEPNHLLTTVDGNNLPARWVLTSVDAHTTRILLREMSFAPAMGEPFTTWVWDPMHFVMEQRMLRGIKERAEGQPLVPGWLALIARVGWVAAGLTVAGLFISRRRWLPFGVLCAVLTIPAFSSTGDLDSVLAGFLALGITVLGLLVFGRRWLAAYPLIVATVLLVLLLAADSWTVFGLGFVAIAAVAIALSRNRKIWPTIVAGGAAPGRV